MPVRLDIITHLSQVNHMQNALGQRGEVLFYLLITKFYGRTQPIFRPQFLGDKWPTVDFVVELTNYPGNLIPYFFVQVKTTQQGYTKKNNRLKVKIPASDMKRLSLFPAPTYIVGVDELSEQGYIVSANGEYNQAATSLSTRFPINRETQDLLWQEVIDFWLGVGSLYIRSNFVDPEWR
jgi:hypothetical protein